MTIHSKELSANKRFAEFCLIVGIIHLCIQLSSIITNLGLILKDFKRFPNCPATLSALTSTEEEQKGIGLIINWERHTAPVTGKDTREEQYLEKSICLNRLMEYKSPPFLSQHHWWDIIFNFYPKLIWIHIIYRNMFTKMHQKSRKFLGIQAWLNYFLRTPQAIPNFIIQGNMLLYLYRCVLISKLEVSKYHIP